MYDYIPNRDEVIKMKKKSTISYSKKQIIQLLKEREDLF